MPKEPEILDLDKLTPPQRLIKLAGNEIDVSKIPSKISIKIMNNYKKIMKGDDESFDLVREIIMDIIEAQNEDITWEFIIDNTDMLQLQKMLQFIVKPIMQPKRSGKGNIKKAQDQSN